MSTITTLSADEFLALPEDPEGRRLELVDGEIIVSPSPNRNHGYVSIALSSLLHFYVSQNDLGIVYADIDTKFNRKNVRRPDILYFNKERSKLLTGNYPLLPPDLCVEILSPSNPRDDRIDKFKLYESMGVAHYWIVDPDARTVEGYSLRDGGYISSGRGGGNQNLSLLPFPDLILPLQRIWHPL